MKISEISRQSGLRASSLAVPQFMEPVEYLALLLDSLQEAIVVWSREGLVTYWNSGAERLFHEQKSACVGRDISTVLLSRLRPPITEAQIVFELNAQKDMRYSFPPGGEIWINAQFIPLYPKHRTKKAIGTMCIARDIISYGEDHQTNFFAQSERLALLGELASGVAHQISNPLTTIIADAQMISRDPEISRQNQASAEAIVQAGWRAQAAVSELIKLSQPIQSKKGPANVNQTIQSALLLTGAYLQAMGVKVRVKLHTDLPEVTANQRDLVDLWVNLLLLSRRTAPGVENCIVQIKTGLDETDAVKVEVDTSMKAKMSPPEWSPGTEMASAVDLAMCRKIVYQNGGEMNVSPGQNGATIHILFEPITRTTHGPGDGS